MRKKFKTVKDAWNYFEKEIAPTLDADRILDDYLTDVYYDSDRYIPYEAAHQIEILRISRTLDDRMTTRHAAMVEEFFGFRDQCEIQEELEYKNPLNLYKEFKTRSDAVKYYKETIRPRLDDIDIWTQYFRDNTYDDMVLFKMSDAEREKLRGDAEENYMNMYIGQNFWVDEEDE